MTRRRTFLAAVAAGPAVLGGCASDTDPVGAGTPGGAEAPGTDTPASEPTPAYRPRLRGSVPDAPSASVSVAMDCEQSVDEYFFSPSVVWLEVGGELQWAVDTCRQWTVAYHPENDRPQRIPDGAEPWQSDVLQGSGTFEHTLEVPGVYDAHGLHERLGQVATVVVGRPDLEGQPAMEPPQESIPAASRRQLSLHQELVRGLL